MRRIAIAALIFALAAATATAAAPARVFRVDKASATILNHRLIVRASGAVRSGGWKLPRLHLLPHVPESATQQIEFLAAPPGAHDVVIQALLPVETTAVFPLPHYGTIQVEILSETNSVTTPIVTPVATRPR
jgi:hypothetical protein